MNNWPVTKNEEETVERVYNFFISQKFGELPVSVKRSLLLNRLKLKLLCLINFVKKYCILLTIKTHLA